MSLYQLPQLRPGADYSRMHLACDPSQRAVVKQIPGAMWDAEEKIWVIPFTAANAWRLRQAFWGQLVIAPQMEWQFNGLIAQHEGALTGLSSSSVALPHNFKTKNTPWKHQAHALQFANRLLTQVDPWKRAVLLAMGMGTGKTYVAIALAENLDLFLVLVVCPLRVVEVWPEQFEAHATKRWRVFPLNDKFSITEKTALVNSHAANATPSRPVAIVMNYETYWREPMRSALLRSNWPLVIYDECHRLKTASGKASLMAARLLDRAQVRIGLSGTPMTNSPLDIFAVGRALNPVIYGWSSTAFKKRHAIFHPANPHHVVGYTNLDELGNKFYSFAFRVGRDVLDLPEATHQNLYCALPDEARRIYRELDEDLITWLHSGEEITAANAMVRLLRLRQVTSGFIKDTTGVERVIHREKANLLADFLEDLDPREPVVIFCLFQLDLDLVREVAQAAGRTVLELSGRRDDWKAFEGGAGDTLAVQIQSGSEGVHFIRAAYCVFYSIGFSLKDYDQALARIHRPGQTRHVHYYHLLARNSVDELTYRALIAKRNLIESVLAVYRGKREAA